MHKSITNHIQTRNSEPQYRELTLESSSSVEYDAPYDNMFEQSEHGQNTKNFRFTPKSSLKLYEWESIPDTIQAHHLIKASELPNYLGCRLPAKSGLNINTWVSYLSNYWDQQLFDLLEYGFPLDFDRNYLLNFVEENHTSENDMIHISQFLEVELECNAILGLLRKNLSKCIYLPYL